MFGGPRRVAAALAAALSLAALPVQARGGPPPGHTCDASFHERLGWVCPEPGIGYRVLLPDGAFVVTHGVDDTIELDASDPRYGTLKPRPPACVTAPDVQFHGRLLYVYPSDAQNRVGALTGDLRDMVAVVNGIIRAEAAEFGRRLDLRMLCSRGEVFIQSVQLPRTEANTTFSTLVRDLLAQGFDDPLAKYYIWFDGGERGRKRGGGTANVATLDDSLSVESRHARGPNFAVTWGVDPARAAGTMLHEIGHTQGAVSANAPNGTGVPNGTGGGLHCNDGRDIMCYPDNAARTNYKPNVCRSMHFDCNHNDYFNPKPKKNSWLANHWNLASPANRFLSGCTYKTGALMAGTGAPLTGVDGEAALRDAGADVGSIGVRTVSIKKACRGRFFALSSYDVELLQAQRLVELPLFELEIDRNASLTRDLDVCFFERTRLLRCASERGGEIGKLPNKATHAQIMVRTGGNARYVFNVV